MLLRALDQLARIERTIRLFDDHETIRVIVNPQQTTTINTVIILFLKCHTYNLKIIFMHICTQVYYSDTLAVLSCDAVAINLSFGEMVTQFISFLCASIV